jgi:hypothetical protein
MAETKYILFKMGIINWSRGIKNMDKDFIKKHREKQAVMYGDTHEASWGDYFAIDLEISTISNMLRRRTV